MPQPDQATLYKLNFWTAMLKQLLEENGQNTDMGQPKLKLAWQVKHEIETMGFPVDCKCENDPANPDKPKVTVTVSRPKDKLTPEEQKEYDDWYSDVIGIKNPNTGEKL